MNILINVIRKIFGLTTPNTIDWYRKKGVAIGNNVDIISCQIDMLCPKLISIGNNVTLTNVTLLTHDASPKKSLGYTRFGKVSIGNNVFIGWNSIILPNVTIGNNVIIGAGSIVSRDIPDNSIAVGSPCHVIGKYEDYYSRQRHNLNSMIVLEKTPSQLTDDDICRLMNGGGYIL